jgi:catechol 2,3-dioxygenase-like lactoylglutathione lyase family enzyme
VVEVVHPRLCFGVNSPRDSKASARLHRCQSGSLHHLAVKAESRAEVDRFHHGLVDIDATIVDGPRVFPEHTPAAYYAVFFKDPDGIKYEVVHY